MEVLSPTHMVLYEEVIFIYVLLNWIFISLFGLKATWSYPPNKLPCKAKLRFIQLPFKNFVSYFRFLPKNLFPVQS